MSYITSIGTANPANGIDQNTIAAFMARAMGLEEDKKRKLQALYRATGIDKRYSVLSDYGKSDDFQFYANNKNMEPFPSTQQRLQIFRKEAVSLSLQAVHNCFESYSVSNKEITHLIVVSCTGMYAPGLDIDLVKELNLNPSIKRTCINFMGCYAAINAIKLADSICHQSELSKVLVVCTELCSLHFQKEDSEDNWLANALFADGSAALLMEATTKSKIRIKPMAFYCDLAEDTETDMAWSIGDFGFEMKLSTYVPEAISKGIRQLTENLLSTISTTVSEIAFFAIHPGGKRILEVIEEELCLPKEKTKFSHEVLRNYGNMSSPTVLFVMRAILNSLQTTNNGDKMLSFAFGPGLTLESMLMEIQID